MDPHDLSFPEAASPWSLGSLLKRLDKALALVALIGGGATLVFLTALSVFNVLVMRKALNAPIKGAEDVLVLALVVLVAIAIPYGARAGSHIEVEVLDAAMSKAFARISMLVMKALGACILAVMSWRLAEAGINAARYGESSQTLLISFAPFYCLLSVSIGLYSIVLLLEMWQLARRGQVSILEIPGERL
jgi:TRAP-type C4-dicarboxylate transport system permease small subunit